MAEKQMDKMEKIVSLCKRRGFVFPGSEIYGGLANTWDYGPLGVELKNNLKKLWWKNFVQERSDMVGIDAGILMNKKVWEASGHEAGFNDALVDCRACKARLRADHLIEDALNIKVEGKTMEEISEIIQTHQIVCPVCGKKDFTAARKFGLMFKTHQGVMESEASLVYLRPETAQAMFVNFKNVLNSTNRKLPFGIAQIGKAFRNEITPGNFIFRTLEFEQMEIEYFLRADEWEEKFAWWREEMEKWMELIGLRRENYIWREHEVEELSHYSKRTMDIEYEFPFGRKELYGIAYRTDFDLSQHQKHSGQSMEYFDQESGEKFLPHVIEPTFGLNRTLLAILCEAYTEEEVTNGKGEKETRVVMKFNARVAPVQVAVLPLSKKPALGELAASVREALSERFTVQFDESQSIGKRYRRQDEIGTPLCVTVDFDSLEDEAVTVRDRDTMRQERVKISELKDYLATQLN